MCVYVCLPVCLFIKCIPRAKDQKRALEPMKVKLQKVVSCHVGAGF